jgi:hypothetical protein
MKKLYTIILFALVVMIANAQSPNWKWAKSAGGLADDFGNSITTDASGNVYVTGYFLSATITFGSYTLTNANTSSADFFIVKYDALGNVLWAKRAGGTLGDAGNSISTVTSGNVYVAGYFSSSTIT